MRMDTGEMRPRWAPCSGARVAATQVVPKCPSAVRRERERKREREREQEH